MKLADYIYYCIYRFMLRTPLRGYADAWPIVYLALAIVIHAMAVIVLFRLIAGLPKGPVEQEKIIGVATLVLISVFFFWYYVLKGNGVRIVKSYEKRGHEKRYAWIGAFIFVETAILPLTFIGILLMTSQLFGWPPPLTK